MEKLLLTGAKGQLGQTFLNHFDDCSLSTTYTPLALDKKELDLSKEDSLTSLLLSEKPSVIVNCGAYTAVDNAERELELAERINDQAVACISRWAAGNRCRVIHISTDFVFDGVKDKPYLISDPTRPIGVYGQTKLAGEKHILRLLPKTGVIIRTSWLYSEFGHNFVKTMIRMMTEKKELSIVSDQVGSPTSAHTLSRMLIKIIEHKKIFGILHWCDGASISWYDFATEIQKQALEYGLLQREVLLKPVKTEDYPTLAARPSYSVLDRTRTLHQLEISTIDWKAELGKVVKRILDRQRNSSGAL